MIRMIQWILFPIFIFSTFASNKRTLHVFSENITLQDLQGEWVNHEDDLDEYFTVEGITGKVRDQVVFKIKETKEEFMVNDWSLKKQSKTLTWKLQHEHDRFWYRNTYSKKTKPNEHKYTVLNRALQKGDETIVNSLLNDFDQDEEETLIEYLNKEDEDKETGLHYASKYGIEKIVKLLLNTFDKEEKMMNYY